MEHEVGGCSASRDVCAGFQSKRNCLWVRKGEEPMLTQAISVVDAARALGLRVMEQQGKRKLKKPSAGLTTRLIALHDAVLEFDRSSGGDLTPARELRPVLRDVLAKMAAAGLDPQSEVAAVLTEEDLDEASHTHRLQMAPLVRPATKGKGFALNARPSQASEDASPAPGDAQDEPSASDSHQQNDASPVVSSPPQPNGPSATSQIRPRSVADDIPYEPEPSDHQDHEVSIDAIMDRLEFAVSKVGWTPKLRRLAAAFRLATIRSLVAQDEIRMSRDDWLELALSVEDAVLSTPSALPSHMQPKMNLEQPSAEAAVAPTPRPNKPRD